eukprot:14478-Heterococcus_DN1.PRE.2
MGVEKQSGRIESIQTVKVLVHANTTISRRTQHSSSVPTSSDCSDSESSAIESAHRKQYSYTVRVCAEGCKQWQFRVL